MKFLTFCTSFLLAFSLAAEAKLSQDVNGDEKEINALYQSSYIEILPSLRIVSEPDSISKLNEAYTELKKDGFSSPTYKQTLERSIENGMKIEQADLFLGCSILVGSVIIGLNIDKLAEAIKDSKTKKSETLSGRIGAQNCRKKISSFMQSTLPSETAILDDSSVPTR